MSQKNKISSLHLYTINARCLFCGSLLFKNTTLLTIIIRRIKSRRNTLFDFPIQATTIQTTKTTRIREKRDVLFFRGRRERRTFDSRC